MNITLTNYGRAQLDSTSKPLQISRYVLGTNYGYTPNQNASGITGAEVYENNIEDMTVINANVYQYSVFLDYKVGSFYFGEIAFYDKSNQCVAVAVNEQQIEKLGMSNRSSGNSMRIDAYLSMIGGTYTTWADSIGSNITFQIPVLASIDNLPPVKDSDPNCYIVSPMSSDSSSTLVYTAGSSGLWHFDTYQFYNARAYSVKAATATTVTIDISGLTTELKQEFIPLYLGDKVIEFTSGDCYSICRVINRATLQSKTVTLSLKTPLAIIPEPGDSILLFSRTQISKSTMRIPIASSDTIGGIKSGDNFIISDDGTLTLAYDPIKKVNGKYVPDAAGNLEIPLYEELPLPDVNLNNVKTMGVYHPEDVSAVQNLPETLDDFALEVLASPNSVIQRVTSAGKVWWRMFADNAWGSWNLILSHNNPICVGTF